MKANVFRDKMDIRVEQVPDAAIQQPTDAVVRITHACICGSDLWYYRGQEEWHSGWRTGHEWMGIVEDVGAGVANLRKGDFVIAPFMFSDGACRSCLRRITSACEHGGFWGGETMDGGQGEAVRVPFADSTLVKLPNGVGSDERLARQLMPLADVLPTGHHAAVSAGVSKGSSVVVIGDGAVGLCGVLAAKRIGAERIFILGHQAERLKMAEHFGATDTIATRGDEAISDVLERSPGGVDAVMECVGTEESLNTAIAIAEPGAGIGYVGVPHHANAFNLQGMFLKNVGLRGGVAPVRSYLDELLADVLGGRLDASSIFDLTVSLDQVPEGFAAMDQRKATKVLVKVA